MAIVDLVVVLKTFQNDTGTKIVVNDCSRRVAVRWFLGNEFFVPPPVVLIFERCLPSLFARIQNLCAQLFLGSENELIEIRYKYETKMRPEFENPSKISQNPHQIFKI